MNTLANIFAWGMILGTLVPAFLCIASVIVAFLI